MLYWPLRAKDLPSGNLKMSKPQGPMAMTKAAENPPGTYFQNQMNTSLKSLLRGNKSPQILLILRAISPELTIPNPPFVSFATFCANSPSSPLCSYPKRPEI
jgi:hypothetical protein